MRLDTHVHTSPGSRCSALSIGEYLREAGVKGLKTICVTNHGDMEDYDYLATTGSPGVLVIPGVEISSEQGDFLVYSADLEFLRGLQPLMPLPDRRSRPEETAVVWAHPFAGIGGGRAPAEFIEQVARQVDGIEVYNGNWPDQEASRRARDVAVRYGLAEMGGSDMHRPGHLLRCYTLIDGGINGVGDLVSAILAGETEARSGP